MMNPTTIELKIEGSDAFREVEKIMQKYIELTNNLNRLAALGINSEIIEDILVSVKPVYQQKDE